VRGHDVKDKQLGHAIPYGVYDLAADEGWVTVGITSDTAQFAVSTGPYAFLKTAGPARLTVSDRGLTLATNRDRGVLITFRVPVPGIEPLGLLRHPELTVTVADVDSLATLLRARIATNHAD